MRRFAQILGCLGLGGALLGCGGGSDDNPSGETCGGADTKGCSKTVATSKDDTTKLQEALIDAKSGDTVCLCPGSYSLTNELSLSVPNVTVKGVGKSVDDTVLDFASQTSGDDGFSVTSDGFTVENLSIKNSPGNGIVVTGAEDVAFRKLKVSWDAGSVLENGAYAVYPVKSTRVTIEDSEIIGASDAGVYVGQCNQAIVRGNKVHGNVAGIEIENTTDAEVYDNESWDNTGGILIFALPNLEKKDGANANVHDNHVHENNRQNFGEKGSIVSNVPTGTGVLLMAADNTQIHANTIENNQSVGVLVVSLQTLNAVLGTKADPLTDPDPEKSYIYANTFTSNGADPQGVLQLLNIKPLENVLWDGVQKTTLTGSNFCLGDPPSPTFRNFNGFTGIGDPSTQSTDPTPYQCTFPELSALSW